MGKLLSKTLLYFLSLFYLFIFIALGHHCCGGFSLLVSRGGYFLVAVYGLLIAVASLLWSTSLTVVVHQLSCPVSYDIFRNQGSKLCLLHWWSDFSPLSHREAFFYYLNITQRNVFKFPCFKKERKKERKKNKPLFYIAAIIHVVL